MGDGPLADTLEITDFPGIIICECKIDNVWDVQLMECLVGGEKMEEILEALEDPYCKWKFHFLKKEAEYF